MANHLLPNPTAAGVVLNKKSRKKIRFYVVGTNFESTADATIKDHPEWTCSVTVTAH